MIYDINYMILKIFILIKNLKKKNTFNLPKAMYNTKRKTIGIGDFTKYQSFTRSSMKIKCLCLDDFSYNHTLIIFISILFNSKHRSVIIKHDIYRHFV